jgi:hypothetical protein
LRPSRPASHTERNRILIYLISDRCVEGPFILRQRFTGTVTITLFLLVASLLPAAITTVSAVPAIGPGRATSLSLAVIPQRLPADGRTYPSIIVGLLDSSGNPSIALNDTTVYLTSSQENVGTVAPSVLIPAGRGYVVANFVATQTAGLSELTASATGIRSAQTVVTTRTPSGFATHLKLAAEPGNVLARPGGAGSLVIQLLDDSGTPAKASTDTTVTISSSNTAIASLSVNTVVVSSGSDLAIVNYTSGYAIGSAFITATATGFTSGITSVGVVGSPPYQLRVGAQPNQVVPLTGGRVVIWLEDPSGNPARASSSIAVAVTSSNLTVAAMTQQKVTILTGQIYAVANFTTTKTKGASTITASAQGLLSGFDTITNAPPLHGPAALKVFVAPNPVLADNSNYVAVLVSVVDSLGGPAVATTDDLVNLTSSNTAVGAITQSVTIKPGGEFATASFHTTYLVGSTVLTASAQGLSSGELQITSFGPIPASVVILKTASSIPADGQAYPGLAVVLQDAFGQPAVAPSDVAVQIVSSRPNLVTVATPTILKAGQTYDFVTVRTGLSPGLTNITASASGYASSATLLSTVVPAPTRLAAFLGPATTINSTVSPDALLTVQLQDISGFPAQARQTTNVVVTSSNRTVLSQPILLSISPGTDYASTYLSTRTFGPTNLTASSAGLSSASVSLKVLNNPISFTISPQSARANVSVSTPITVSMTALGEPFKGAKVVWLTSAGSQVSPGNSTTNAAGLAQTSFTGTTQGEKTVTARVTSPLTGPVNLTASIFVLIPPTPPQPSLYQQIAPYLWIIVVVVVVVIVVLLYFFWWRRRKKKAGAKGEAAQPYDDLEEMPAGTGEGTSEVAGEGTSEEAPPSEPPMEETGEASVGESGGEATAPESAGPSDETI